MHASAEDKNQQGKTINFVLGTPSNPSFIKSAEGMAYKPTSYRTVQTPNGALWTNRTAMLPLKTGNKVIGSQPLIYKRLPTNVLSAMPIINKMGAIIFDEEGVALLPKERYKKNTTNINILRVLP